VQGVANPDYHLPARPHFDSVEIKGGGDATTAARAVLQTGDYDYAWSVTVDDEVLRRIETGGKGQVVHTSGGDTAFILLNAADPWTELEGERAHPRSRHPLFSDPAVRRALRLLVDRRALQAHVYGRSAEATANILNHPPIYDSTRMSLDSSTAQANALLDGAGWVRGSDGVRSRAGKRLALVFQTSTNPVLQKVQSVLKQACAQAGIAVELKAISASVFFSSDPGNKDTVGKFLADLQMYTFTRTPDPERYMQLFASWEACSQANKWLGLNSSRWASADYDAALRATAAELDPVRRAALFIRMNDLVCDDGYVIPLAVRANVTALGTSLVAPTSGWDTPLAAIHDWYRKG
jgi:peptide/nickel transport system substrate-binding protein